LDFVPNNSIMAPGQRKDRLKAVKKKVKTRRRNATIRREAALSHITHQLATAHALQAPLFECWQPKGLFETGAGTGTVLVTRKPSTNQVLMAAFWVDVFCLGIKDANCMLMGENEYRIRLDQIERLQNLVAVQPACAKKLVVGSQVYAEELGFLPQGDYAFAKRIFRDIHKEACPRSFTFGWDGRPLYRAGAGDSARFSKDVVNRLTAKLGSEGFRLG
jgi:hypothetical protein